MTTPLSSPERKALRSQTRMALIIGTSLFILLTGLNLAIYYRDVLTGIGGVERPPLSQLIIIEVAAFIIGLSSYYFPSKKWIKDLSLGTKEEDMSVVHMRFVKNNDGAPQYTLRLMNNLIVVIDKQLYSSLHVGDRVNISYAPQSSYVFDVRKVNRRN